jgi:hypothetical protein
MVAQRQSVGRLRLEPAVDFGRRRENDGHGLGATIALGSVVRNANKSFVVAPSFTFRTDLQRVQIPAKRASGRLNAPL